MDDGRFMKLTNGTCHANRRRYVYDASATGYEKETANDADAVT